VWIQIPEERLGLDPPIWRVFGSDGVWLQDLTLPPRFTLTYVQGDLIYGVRRDDLDLETVEVLRLERAR
jgi:hypothetical protein